MKISQTMIFSINCSVSHVIEMSIYEHQNFVHIWNIIIYEGTNKRTPGGLFHELFFLQRDIILLLVNKTLK